MSPSPARLARTQIAPVESNLAIRPVPSRGLTPSASEPAHSNQEKAETKTRRESSPPRILQRDEAAIFIHVMHAEACRIFGTVLGPNVNAAHKDHFHLDMTKRRYAGVCK
ncbi:MAG: extensin family protein [Kiloniellales bacterium]|nr:extensin family protein [Kiloniellales bacterium]